MTSKVIPDPLREFACSALVRAVLSALSCVLFCTACRTSDDFRVGIGAHGVGRLLVEPEDHRKAAEDQSGLLIDGFRYEMRGRAADVRVSAGGRRFQGIAGVEWSRHEGDEFQAQLLGVRTSLSDSKRFAGSYVIVLGRNVDGSESHTPFFDGFDLGLGYEAPLRGPLLGDVCLSWSYVDGDAISAGRDSIFELRLAFGVSFEF